MILRNLHSIYGLQPDRAWLALSLLAVVLLGCESSGNRIPPNRGQAGAPPSSDVERLAAWRDAETVSRAAPGRSSVVGHGRSMAPLYGDNTMLVISKIDFRDLAVGMTVAYVKEDGRQVVHRLVAQRPDGDWTSQGFNNEHVDSTPVTPWNLIGVIYASLVHEFPEDS